MSLSGTLVGIVIMMVHPLTGKFFSKRWNYYIWLLVVIRLLLPAQLTMALPGGILIDASHMGVETKAENGEADLADGNLMYTEPASNPGTNAERASEQEAGRSTNPALNAERASEQEAGRSSNPGMNAEQTLKQEAGQVANSELNTEDNRSLYAGILFGAEIIWLTGLIAALGIRLWNYRRFVRAVRMNAVSISDGRIVVSEHSVSARLHMRKAPPVYESAFVSGPVTIGLWKPVVILPAPEESPDKAQGTQAGQSCPEKYHLIFHHELVHVARRDLWIKWLYQILLCIHWFNPFLYLIERKMSADCELACDEAVLAGLTPEGRKVYGNILLDIAERNVLALESAFTTTFITGKSELKRRLNHVLTFRKPTVIKMLLSICAMAGTMFLTACGGIYLSYDGYDWEEELSSSESDLEVSSRNNFQGTEGRKRTGDAGQVYDNTALLAGADLHDRWQAAMYRGGGNEVTISRFALNGSDSIRIVYAEVDRDIEVTSNFDLKDGRFKIVHIAPDGDVSIINDTGEKGSRTITLRAGRNAIKMVGQAAVLKDVEISFSGLKERDFEHIYYSEEDEYGGQIKYLIEDGSLEKDKFMESIYYLKEEDISEGFNALLKQGEDFSDSEIYDIFLYSNADRSGEYLIEAINGGLMEPVSVDALSDLMFVLEGKTLAELIGLLPQEDFFEALENGIFYLSEEEIEECLFTYIDAGGKLSYEQFNKIGMYLNESTIRKLDERMALKESGEP